MAGVRYNAETGKYENDEPVPAPKKTTAKKKAADKKDDDE